MDANDRAAIERLFARLADFEGGAPARDREAEDFIAGRIARQPGAPYYMAQTIVAQEQALKAAEARLAELGELPDQPGRRDMAPGPSAAQPGPWGRRPAGGGFLAGAAQTALGVAGGVMLANALGGLFGGAAEAAEDPFAGASHDGDFDAGDDFGDFDL